MAVDSDTWFTWDLTILISQSSWALALWLSQNLWAMVSLIQRPSWLPQLSSAPSPARAAALEQGSPLHFLTQTGLPHNLLAVTLAGNCHQEP